MKRTGILIACIAAVSMLPAFASADMMTYNGVGLNEVVTTHAYDMNWNPLLANDLSVYAGQEKLHYKGQDIIGYCADLNQSAGSVDVTELPITSLNNGWRIGYLFNTYAGTVSTNLDAAALGVAIWELMSEPTGGPFSVDANSANRGHFWITDNAAAQAAATTLLNSIPGSYSSPNMPIVLYSPTEQDFVIASGTVPEPATLALMGLGGIGIVLRRRRRLAA